MKTRKVNIHDQGSLTYNGSPDFIVLGRERPIVQISNAQSSPLQSYVFHQQKTEVDHSEDANGETKNIEMGLEPEDIELLMAATMENKIYPMGQIKEELAKKDVMIAKLKAELAQRDVAIAQEKLLSCHRVAMITELKAQPAQLIRKRCNLCQNGETITGLRTENIQKSTVIAQKDKLIARKDATIARLMSESAQKDTLIVEKDKLITEKNDMIARLMAECVQKGTVIVEMDNLIAEKDERITKHKVESAKINDEIAEMKKMISEKNDAITKEQEELDFFIDRLIESKESKKVLEQRAATAEELVQDCLKRRQKTKAKLRHLQGEIKAMKEAENGELLMAQIQAIDEFKFSNEYRDAVLKGAMDFLEEALSHLRKETSHGECKFANKYWDDVFKSSMDILEGCLSDFRKRASY